MSFINRINEFGFLIVFTIAFVSSIQGCTEYGESGSPIVNSNSNQPTTTIAKPIFARQFRQVVDDNLSAEVSINEIPVTMERINDDWIATLPLPANQIIDVSLTWYEDINGISLPLASYSETIEQVTADQTVTIVSEDYNTNEFDFDADGISNLVERQQGYNAFDENIPGADPIFVDPIFVDPIFVDPIAEDPIVEDQIDNTPELIPLNRLASQASSLMIVDGCIRLLGDIFSDQNLSETMCDNRPNGLGFFADHAKGVSLVSGCPTVTIYEDIDYRGENEVIVFCR